MPPTLQLENGKHITYESALRTDVNIVNQAAYLAAATKLAGELWAQRRVIQALVKHHLRLRDEDVCIVKPQDEWIRGGFNLCIPVEVHSGSLCNKLIFRCAMPHKLAEARYPGTVDEKLSCEVGTYVWMQNQCRDIRIPHLYGFGFSDHCHFTHEEQMPLFTRLWRMFQRRLCVLLRYRAPSHYTAHQARQCLPTAYMLLEDIGPSTGQMLSNTWEKHRNDPERRQRLFRGMACLMLSLARVPQPRIGSFQFHLDGTITLTNRPLPCSVIILENEGAPRITQKNETYPCTEPFVADMLTFHDNSFLSNPNAIYDAGDCRGQMAVRALLRTLSHHYIKRERRDGPFYLQFTDLHASNIFVDDDWNVTGIIDLEWVCSLPAEMLDVPYWLTGCGIDEIADKLDEFDKVRREFMCILEEEEAKLGPKDKSTLARIMHDSWESKAVWFWHCLTSVNAMFYLMDDHICPNYSPLSSKVEEVLSQYWCQGSASIVTRKVDDHEGYVKDLQALFSK